MGYTRVFGDSGIHLLDLTVDLNEGSPTRAGSPCHDEG